MSPDVLILPSGVANLRSVEAMFERLGVSTGLLSTCSDLTSPVPLVIPGVGSFGELMGVLAERGWADGLRRRLDLGLPTLGICLGMQILFEGSEEAPGVPGFGVAPGTIERYPGPGRVPQMGWNAGFYFANSYRATSASGWECAMASYQGDFVAAMRKGRVWGCQFHPELSSDRGQEFIQAWLSDGDLSIADTGPTNRVIPCLDVRDGRVVKGVQFQELRDSGDPVSRAALYEEQGADEIVILDVSATDEGRAASRETVRAVRNAIGIPLTVGGGVRSVSDVAALLAAGADKVAVNTAAVAEPAIVGEMAARFGRQCTVVAIDAKAKPGGWQVVTNSGRNETAIDAVDWASMAEKFGAGEILLTSWDRDGTGRGYDLELLMAVSDAISVPLIASGGGSSAESMSAALEAGADAVLAASVFHDGVRSVGDIKRELSDFGWAVRR